MANNFIKIELGRVLKGINERAKNWLPVFDLLAYAEDSARNNFRSLSEVANAGYNRTIDYKQQTIDHTFRRTTVTGMEASLLIDLYFFLPINRGIEACYEQLLKRPGYSSLMQDTLKPIDSFATAKSQYGIAVRETTMELRQLIALIDEAPNGMTIHDEEVATSTMLLSPVFYAPTKLPDQATIANAIELRYWLTYVVEGSAEFQMKDTKGTVQLGALQKRLRELGVPLPPDNVLSTAAVLTLIKGLADNYLKDSLDIYIELPPWVRTYINRVMTMSFKYGQAYVSWSEARL